MKVIVSIFTIISQFAISWADELRFVSIVYRHGDRSPVLSYPTDPHPSSTWPNGLGQLTNLGKNQTYQLGKYIRDRYKDFLPTKYHEEDIYVMSSDKSRTLMSAYCVLAGLYEPQGDDVWLESINWQPIPVHSLPQNLDNLMYNKVTCPKFHKLLNDHVFVANSETIDKFEEIVEEVSRNGGISRPNTALDVVLLGSGIYDCLSVQERYGLKLPEWTKKFYPEPLRKIAKFVFGMRSYDVSLKRLRCGPLVKNIIKHFEEVRNGTLKVKMWQYSAHDGTIVDLFQCLGVYDGEIVPYSSAVFLELHETEEDFEIVINYKTNDEVKELEIPGCKARCQLNSFKELVKDVIPNNWEEECKL